VTSDESVYDAAGCAGRAGGHLEVLVNNAGITGPVRDPHDFTAGDMTEAVALFTCS
jgi:NAD(P)-dependent dehydrogenase (short-subunit alcohol dehydrogenase family)